MIGQRVSNLLTGSDTYNTDGKGLPFFQGKAEFGKESPVPVKWCSAPTRVAEPGDILLSVRAPVGPTNVASERCCIGRGLAAIRPKDGRMTGRYLLHFFRRFELDLAQRGVGSTFTAINRKDIEQFKISVPPLADQEQVVSVLDQADRLRQLRATAEERTSQLTQAMFLEMFGDPKTNPKGWDVATLGDYITFITSGSRGWAKYYSESGAKFIRVQNLTGNCFRLDDVAFVSPPDSAETRRTKVQSGDLFISITGVVGLSTVAPPDLGDAYVSQHVAIVRLNNDVDPLFVSAFLANEVDGQRQIAKMQYGQTKPGLNLSQIRSIQLYIPPLSLQRKFADLISEVKTLEKRMSEHRRALDQLFDALLAGAFTS